MARYIELMKAFDSCGRCYEGNGSGPDVDAGLDNGNERSMALHYLERAKFHELPMGLTVSDLNRVSDMCDSCTRKISDERVYF